MEHIRWYDKNLYTKDVFAFIEKLNDSERATLAQEMVQMVTAEAKDINSDTEINNVAAEDFECKRWYDSNPDLHFAFSIIKRLPENRQKELMKKTVESAALMIFGRKKEY